MKNYQQMAAIFKYNSAIQFLLSLFTKIFFSETKPTQQTLLQIVMSFFFLNTCQSVKYIFDNFIKQYFGGKLSSIYYTVDESKLLNEEWHINFLTEVIESPFYAIGCPIFFIIDDTLVEKCGDSFQYVEQLFDHTAKNGSNYLKGHCFVSLVLLIPMKFGNDVVYVRVPLMHRMWVKEAGESKLQIARDMVLSVFNIIKDTCKSILLCDSWYPKGEVLELHNEYGIPIICSARSDTKLFDLPEAAKPGKRGRRAKRGKRLSKDLNEVFEFVGVSDCDFSVAFRKVMTQIFGDTPCTAYATKSNKTGEIRLFLATDDLDLSNFDTSLIDTAQAQALIKLNIVFLPLALYWFRWNIETCYYEQKVFWGFCDYKLRSKAGIEAMIALQTLAYAAMSILPYISKDFACLQPLSIQERRFRVGELIREIISLYKFEHHLTAMKDAKGNCTEAKDFTGHIRRVEGYVDQLKLQA